MAEALAADIKENILTCSICLGEYEDPRVLPCYHTFCFGCICDHASRTVTPNRTFLCPICREEVQFPAGGLNELKKNFVFSKAKDIITEQRDRGTFEKEQPNVATVTQDIAQMTISCKKHPNKELEYYCEDDSTVICGKCIATGHGGHRISSVEQVAKINRDKIKAALGRTMDTTNRFKESIETASEKGDPHIKTLTIENIKTQAQSMRKYIDQREETLISEVNSAYDVRKKQEEANKDILEFHHTSLHSACDFAQELITNGTDSDVMVHAKPLIERLTVLEKTPVPTPDTPAQISYKPGRISTAGLRAMLGQLTPLAGQGTNPRSAPLHPVFLDRAECVHSFSALMEDDINTYISGLAIDMEYLFVADTRNDKTKIFTHAGEFKFDIKLDSPVDVAVSQTGHLYITSRGGKCVKVYSTRGQQVTTMGQGLLESPCGIKLNRQVYSVNDYIVISYSHESRVSVLSPTGKQLYQYGTHGSGYGEMNCPQGVCIDSYGHIFIADSYNHRIVALNFRAYFMRYIATEEDGLEFPVALAINPAGQLVVAELQGKVKTFQYLE
ncbi:tripartite motif-containing protein 2-like [Lingula anatina]|uniref:Tripartite motif-containing protein 2-like n=1 Tax=Lingula anatina TaxID=7574 RepID=A0A1S3IY31_LINAN|nr:tripartite motif-containing protein 2-like [Lingula anatina]|eukprot:XP_013402938.1 tripartite motif-containing protein 2-like [Lingula anatina]